MKETNILKMCQMEAARLGCTLWRNNQGKFQDKTGRWVTFGVCNPGGSDLIGIYRGRFVAFEIKQPGKAATEAQANFLEFIDKSGGISAVLTSPDQVKDFLK